MYYPPQHNIPNALPVYALHQNDSDENRIEQSVDGDLATRWAVEGTEGWAWGTYDLGSVKTLDKGLSVFPQWASACLYFLARGFRGRRELDESARQKTTSGKTLELEAYDMKGAKARYVKYLGSGNTVNMWNSLTEIVFTEKK